MTKLLIHSNSPLAPTGYGNQVSVFASRLAERYELAVSAFYGLEGAPIFWNEIPILPGLGGEFGNEYLVQHARNFFGESPKNGLVMTLMDVWVLQARVVQQLNCCSWVPVDHDPAPPMVLQFFSESGSVPIAMSRFGEERLEQFDPLYVPHGVDVDVYKPHPQKEAREKVGFDPDRFIIGMVAANKGSPSRKGFQQAFQAFKRLLEKHPDALLYLHTGLNSGWTQGEDLGAMLVSLGIPERNLAIADQYRLYFAPLSPKKMALLYSSFDCLINPSLGEGFGIPMLEAQACGTPVIATDFSAMQEVAGAGWKVGYERFWTNQRAWQATPRISELAEALEEAATLNSDKKASMAKKARRHAMKYAAQKVLTEHFLPALEQVEERLIKPKAPSVPAKVVA